MEIEIDNKSLLMDDEDLPLFQAHKWYVDSKGYLIRNIYLGKKRGIQKNQVVRFHRLILGLKGGTDPLVDHINGNTLDNRKNNLRVCSYVENGQNRKIGRNNTSGYKGVSWIASRKKWQATIQKDKKPIFIGYFDTPEDAARAYGEKANEFFGEFAKTT